MRALRRPAAAVVAAVLALSACTGDAGNSGNTGSTGNTGHTGHTQEPDRASAPTTSVVSGPQVVSEQLPDVATEELWLPRSVEERRLVAPGWDAAPLHAEGVFLGWSEEGASRAYIAVDIHGTVLWRAERPADGSRAWLSRTSTGRPLAVLAHDDGPGVVAVHAYDLETGEAAWGPVQSSGPLPGGGLVLQSEGQEGGQDASPAALDPDTGAVIPAPPGARLVGQHDGVLLTVQEGALHASDARSGRQSWQTQLADHGLDPAALRPGTGEQEPGLALLDADGGGGGGDKVVVDLADGTVLGTAATSAGVDEATGVRVVHEGATLRGVDPAGMELWSQSVSPDVLLLGVGGVFAYVREGDTVRALNVVGGDVVEAYDAAGQGRIVVPWGFGSLGTASLIDGDRHLLATAPEEPSAP